MSKILIAYVSVNGTAKECAEKLAEQLTGPEITICDLAKNIPEPQDFDLIVVGSCVRFGKIRPAAKKFLNLCASVCQEKPIGVFLCCGLSHNFDEYREHLIPIALRRYAFLISNFGGYLNPKGKPFWDRFWLRAARSTILESEMEDGEFTPVLPGILPENIGQMAVYARKALSEPIG